MNKPILSSLLAMSLVVPFTASASADIQLKLATMDTNAIVENSKQMREMKKAITEKFTKQRDELLGKEKKLNEEITAFKKNEATMTKKKREAKEKDLLGQRQKIAEEERNFQQALYTAQADGMKQIMADVKAATEKVAKKQGYAIVLPVNEAIYSQLTDLTEDIKAALN